MSVTVRREKMKCFWAVWMVIILAALPSPTFELIKCKRSIMYSFYLTGMKYSIVEPMHICPHVHDKCCTLADEVKIKHLIEKHTQPILERRVALVMRSIGAILDSFMELVNIDPSLMVLSYSVPKNVPIKDRRCEATPRQIPTQLENYVYWKYHDGVNKYIRRMDIDKFLQKTRRRSGPNRHHDYYYRNQYNRYYHPIKRPHYHPHMKHERRKKHHYHNFGHPSLFKTQSSTVYTHCNTRELPAAERLCPRSQDATPIS